MSKTIYILSCKKNKYYIGSTNRPLKERILEHFEWKGSSWTYKYPPIKVVETIQNADNFDEDKNVKKYMFKYGIDNVRGGSYSSFQLSNEMKNLITSLERETLKIR